MSIIYKNFKCGTLFDIHPTKAYKMSNKELLNIKGIIPVLSNSSFNNGICGYSNYEPTEKGGIITFSDTTTGADTMFYQPDDFIGYSHVQGMYPYYKEYWDKYTLLYFISAMKKASGSHWNYSNKFNRALVSEIESLLPVKKNKDNEPLLDTEYKYHKEGYIPDFDYMREVIKKIEQDKIKELEQDRVKVLEQYLIVTGLNDYKLTDEDIEILSLSGFGNYKELYDDKIIKTYKDFKISDLFSLEKVSNKLNKEYLSDDYEYPVYSSDTNNNGIIGYTDKPEFICSNEIPVYITFGDHTRALNIARKSFGVLDNVKVLIPCIDNDKVLLYMIAQWQKQIPNLGYSRHWKIAKECLISLPIKLDDKNPLLDKECRYHKDGYIPDWDFMEKYIRVIEKIVISDAMKYKDEYIKQLKGIVNQ